MHMLFDLMFHVSKRQKEVEELQQDGSWVEIVKIPKTKTFKTEDEARAFVTEVEKTVNDKLDLNQKPVDNVNKFTTMINKLLDSLKVIAEYYENSSDHEISIKAKDIAKAINSLVAHYLSLYLKAAAEYKVELKNINTVVVSMLEKEIDQLLNPDTSGNV